VAEAEEPVMPKKEEEEHDFNELPDRVNNLKIQEKDLLVGETKEDTKADFMGLNMGYSSEESELLLQREKERMALQDKLKMKQREEQEKKKEKIEKAKKEMDKWNE